MTDRDALVKRLERLAMQIGGTGAKDICDVIAALSQPAGEQEAVAHPDDAAIDKFAAAMKAKMAKKRAEGCGGWDDPEQCTIDYLARLFHDHVHKGDPVDIGNFAMMLWNRISATSLPAQYRRIPAPATPPDTRRLAKVSSDELNKVLEEAAQVCERAARTYRTLKADEGGEETADAKECEELAYCCELNAKAIRALAAQPDFCIDEGCPQHGTQHICIYPTQQPERKGE